MVNTDTLLLAVDWNYDVRIGLPPSHCDDDFNARAAILGNVADVGHIASSPDGELFCIRDGDLYRGPMPSNKAVDWFSVAQRVGRFGWSDIKLLFFRPNGDLYCTTYDGEFYMGAPPDNEHVPWMYQKAKRIGSGYWNQFSAMCFDLEGVLYAVENTDKFYKGPPPTDEGFPWMEKSTLTGDSDWDNLTHFMSFAPDGKLWCVDKNNGNFYSGDPPASPDTKYLETAQCLGCDYQMWRFHVLIKDTTIRRILSLEFLTDEGKIVSEQPEVLEQTSYDNRESSSRMRSTFTFQESIKESSSFTHEHGFTFEMGVEVSFKMGIPVVGEGGTKITMNTSNAHNWSFTKSNVTEASFSSSSDIELEPGKAIRMVASVMRAEMAVPYKARARTLFGSEVDIGGMWRGVSHYNLRIVSEDYNK